MVDPMNEVSKMRQSGLSDEQIISSLEHRGFSQKQIRDAMNQTGIKQSIGQRPASNELQPSLFDEDIPVPEPPSDDDSSYSPSGASAGVPAPSFEPSYQNNFSPVEYPVQELGASPEVEELVESVVQDKWSQFSDTLANMEVWRSRMNDDLVSVKQELLRMSKRFDMLQNAVMGKVEEYSHSVTDMSTELKAMEKVFQNIMEPLTSNIKELSKITDELRSDKRRSSK